MNVVFSVHCIQGITLSALSPQLMGKTELTQYVKLEPWFPAFIWHGGKREKDPQWLPSTNLVDYLKVILSLWRCQITLQLTLESQPQRWARDKNTELETNHHKYIVIDCFYSECNYCCLIAVCLPCIILCCSMVAY